MIKTSTQKIAYISMMAVVITLCAWITIPFAVPFTMQTFAVFLSLKLLGGKMGTASILLYIVLGAVGLPVFSGFGAGIGYIMGPTGGFLIGFLLCGLLYTAYERFIKKPTNDTPALIAGAVLYYLIGTAWFILYTAQSDSPAVWQGVMLCVVPYIIPDTLKLILTEITSKKLKRIIKYD